MKQKYTTKIFNIYDCLENVNVVALPEDYSKIEPHYDNPEPPFRGMECTLTSGSSGHVHFFL